MTTKAVPPTAAPRIRTPRGAQASHSAATAAAPSSDSASLTSKANPTSTPAPAIPRARPRRVVRTATTAPATQSAAMTESIVSLRAVTTALGSTARASPPTSPAARPNSVAASAITITTRTTPPIASGRCRGTGPNPSARVLATCSHRSTGGLSIATRRPGSKAPPRNAAHDVPMLRTAAS